MLNRRDAILGSCSLAGGLLAAPQMANARVLGYQAHFPAPPHLRTIFKCSETLMLHIRDLGVKPPLAAIVYGLAHKAGFLAMNGIAQRYTSPFRIGAGPAHADLDAAYASAFFYAIAHMLNMPLTQGTRQAVKHIPNSEAKQAGLAYGTKVGKQVAAMRYHDGTDSWSLETETPEYRRQAGNLAWEPTMPYYSRIVRPRMPAFGQPLYPSMGHVKPLGHKSVRGYRVPEFHDLRSPEFTREAQKVFLIGGDTSNNRTADDEEVAWFWEDGPVSLTPAGHFLLIALQLIGQRRMAKLEAARLLALQTIAMADSGIAAWDSKYAHYIFRPETLFRKRGKKLKGLNSALPFQQGWRSLIPTPGFPAYTSGHSCFGGSGGAMLQLELGDACRLTTAAPDWVNWPTKLKGVSRSYRSIQTMIDENGISREYGGVHWESDNLHGLAVGRSIAINIQQSLFRPRS